VARSDLRIRSRNRGGSLGPAAKKIDDNPALAICGNSL
jgi:hypothetical protein